MKIIRHSTLKAAFTLVELSVVLVIIGLLVGGILAGKNLVHNAEIRGVITQINDYRTAISQFKTQYRYLPGDMPNAPKYWPGTTGGNGDGIIEPATANGYASVSDPDNEAFDGERAQLFVQLGLAGLTQTFDGSTTLGKGYPQVAGYNAGMFVSGSWQTTSATNITNFIGNAQSSVYLYMGVCNASTFGINSGFNDCAIFTPEDAWTIDKKIDDGVPLTGSVLGESYNTSCVTNNSASGENSYATTSTAVGCNLLIDLKH